jgi:hypothetical protein
MQEHRFSRLKFRIDYLRVGMHLLIQRTHSSSCSQNIRTRCAMDRHKLHWGKNSRPMFDHCCVSRSLSRRYDIANLLKVLGYSSPTSIDSSRRGILLPHNQDAGHSVPCRGLPSQQCTAVVDQLPYLATTAPSPTHPKRTRTCFHSLNIL